MESNSVARFVLKCPDSNDALDYGCAPVLLALSYFCTAVKHIHVRLSRASLAVGDIFVDTEGRLQPQGVSCLWDGVPLSASHLWHCRFSLTV